MVRFEMTNAYYVFENQIVFTHFIGKTNRSYNLISQKPKIAFYLPNLVPTSIIGTPGAWCWISGIHCTDNEIIAI